MTLAESELAYPDCFHAYDKALASNRGIRMTFETYEAAIYFRLRCHQARKLRRKRNKAIYTDPEHGLHGRCEYDALQLTIRAAENEAEQFYLYFRKLTVVPGAIEDLDDLEPNTPLIDSKIEDQLQLPAPTEDIPDLEFEDEVEENAEDEDETETVERRV